MKEFLNDFLWFFDFSGFTFKDFLEGTVIVISFIIWVFGCFVFFS